MPISNDEQFRAEIDRRLEFDTTDHFCIHDTSKICGHCTACERDVDAMYEDEEADPDEN